MAPYGDAPLVYTPDAMAVFSSDPVSNESDVGEALGTGVGTSEGNTEGNAEVDGELEGDTDGSFDGAELGELEGWGMHS